MTVNPPKKATMKIAKKICAGAIAAALTALLAGVSAAAGVPPPERLRARESFAKDGFGIFVHWGLYAAWGKGEWYLNKSRMPLADYEAKAAAFNPTNFDARAWAKAFAGAGARYVTITSRHHDGFSMFDTAQTDYDIVDATPFRRDPLKELAAACAAEGLGLGFYYSLLDWRRPDYPRGRATDDYGAYFAFMTGEPVPFVQKEHKGDRMLSITLDIPDGVPDYIVRLDVEPFASPASAP